MIISDIFNFEIKMNLSKYFNLPSTVNSEHFIKWRIRYYLGFFQEKKVSIPNFNMLDPFENLFLNRIRYPIENKNNIFHSFLLMASQDIINKLFDTFTVNTSIFDRKCIRELARRDDKTVFEQFQKDLIKYPNLFRLLLGPMLNRCSFNEGMTNDEFITHVYETSNSYCTKKKKTHIRQEDFESKTTLSFLIYYLVKFDLLEFKDEVITIILISRNDKNSYFFKDYFPLDIFKIIYKLLLEF